MELDIVEEEDNLSNEFEGGLWSDDNVRTRALLGDTSWVGIQQRTFTRWVNKVLHVRGHKKLEDIVQELDDGVALIELLEILTAQTLKAHKKPTSHPQKLENVITSLDFIKKQGIRLTNVGAEDIVNHVQKLILGLIWTLILNYQIQGKGKSAQPTQTTTDDGKPKLVSVSSVANLSSARGDLLKWVQEKIPECNVKNFSSSWNDGKAICHLVAVLRPGSIDLHHVDSTSDSLSNAKLGESLAELELNIPQLLSPEDMVNPEGGDELSMMTYISQFRDFWLQHKVQPPPEPILIPEPKPEPKPEPTPIPTPVPEHKPEHKPEPKPEHKPEHKPEPKPKPTPPKKGSSSLFCCASLLLLLVVIVIGILYIKSLDENSPFCKTIEKTFPFLKSCGEAAVPESG